MINLLVYLSSVLRSQTWNQTQSIVSPQDLMCHRQPLQVVECATCPVLWGHKLSFTAGKPFISLTGPSQRTTPGNPVPFNCTAGPFSSWDFNVTWMKGRDEHPASAQHIVTNDKGNYSVTSKVWVTLARQDILLGITCEVTHRELEEPLRKTMNLSQVLQGGWAVGVCICVCVLGGCYSPNNTGF